MSQRQVKQQSDTMKRVESVSESALGIGRASLAPSSNKIKRGKGKQQGEQAKTPVQWAAEVEEAKACCDAEAFELRECLLKEERAYNEACDTASEKTYALKRAETKILALEQNMEHAMVRARANEDVLAQQLLDVTQSNQRMIEKVADLEEKKSNLELEVERLKRIISGKETDVAELQGHIRDVEVRASVVEDCLKKAIRTSQRDTYELRASHAVQQHELVKHLDSIQDDLQGLVTRVESSLGAVGAKVEAAETLSDAVETLTMKYQSLLEKCRLRVSRFCRELCEVASVHSNVSPYVKKILSGKTCEELTRLIDTLAFENNVKQYLEALYPPVSAADADARSVFPSTPSAVLLTSAVGAVCAHKPEKSDERDSHAKPPGVPAQRLAPAPRQDSAVNLSDTHELVVGSSSSLCHATRSWKQTPVQVAT
ncbi:hypothetical protein DIPPA_21634 [Diplonema papillatum]|nr:hypothetical protein DIPPA_21634 [Diplonema papillatum]KAJ9472860.1 hypothetical protein DIPPA_21634 [Diplonema papillatum]